MVPCRVEWVSSSKINLFQKFHTKWDDWALEDNTHFYYLSSCAQKLVTRNMFSHTSERVSLNEMLSFMISHVNQFVILPQFLFHSTLNYVLMCWISVQLKFIYSTIKFNKGLSYYLSNMNNMKQQNLLTRRNSMKFYDCGGYIIWIHIILNHPDNRQ